MPVQLSFSIVLRLCQVVTVAFLWHLSAPTHTPHCLFFAPQSYAGKYVPSIAHYIYQMDAIVSGKAQEVDHPRPIPADEIQDPLSKLGGIAIGNGWTGGWRWRTCRVCSVSTPTAAEGDDVGWMSGRVVEAWMDVKIIE